MKKYGLLGEKLGHSFSPVIHKLLCGYDYSLFEVAPEKLGDFLRRHDFDGINVTIPYKKAVLPYCAELSPEAAEIGSVNTIIRRVDGTLYGDNTDCAGFYELAKKMRIPVSGKALILGNGGVAPAIRSALKSLGADEIITVSRRGENNYVNLNRHYDASLIVNASPVGMYPDNGSSLIPLESFLSCRGVIDVVYNPLRTKLVLDAEALGIRSCGGLYMLVAQAARSAELFTGEHIPPERIDEVYEAVLASVRNVVLIGMPGCGKTTAACALGEMTGRRVFDCDSEIVRRTGMSIPEYFERFGVESFRELESAVLYELCSLSGVIIATGGGVVMRERNYSAMHQNGLIVFLQREISELPTDGRPISQATDIKKLADMRLPIYNKWCDKKVCGNSPEDTAQKIKEMLFH